MAIALRLGPLKADGYKIHRSSATWLCEPGQMCQANQPVAYFNLSFESTATRLSGLLPFGEEREVQVVGLLRRAGRVMYDSQAEPGGYLSVLGFNVWDADTVLAQLEIDDSVADADEDAGLLRLVMLAGRRMTRLVDVHAGLLPGWHACSRAWWWEPGEKPFTLLSLGLCDVTGVILGEQRAFLELARAETESSHFVFVPDQPITPSAPVLLDQLQRTEAQFKAISADIHAAFSKSETMPTSNDWMFAGALLTMLQRNPIRETYDLLSADGLGRSGPADAVLLSLIAEPSAILRHKTLGWRLHVLRHHYEAGGPMMHHWLDHAFEVVQRSIDDIKKDYEDLIDAITKSTGAHVIVLNRMSTSGNENISSYAPFDFPLRDTLANIAAKELNLMLHDVSENRNITIIDVDAIAAEIGGAAHLPDGVHQSKAFQQILRGEVLRVLKELRKAR